MTLPRHVDSLDLPLKMTTAETGAVLRTTPATVCLYAQSGWLTGSKIGRHWLIDRASVLRLLKQGTGPANGR